MAVTIVGLGEQNVCQISPVKLVQHLHKQIGEVEKMYKVKEKRVLKIVCKDKKQMKKALEMSELAGVSVKVERIQSKVVGSKGVIHRVDEQITEEELQELLKDQGVMQVKRFKKRVEGVLGPTPSVLLFFDTQQMPASITFLYQTYRVHEYVAPLTRCFQCQQFGHVKSQCRGKIRCVRCGDNHHFEECQTKDNPKCFRCKENHSAAYQGCIYYKEAKEIQTLKLENKVSYAQAAKQYKSQQSTEMNRQSVSNTQPSQQVETTQQASEKKRQNLPQENEKK
ncbi:uncharacterized protein [Diadema antillarum]|uniref:uncharacterized protein n=1 Tax=Diadema antillarum TaxID=105358 RepID=UPI003A8B8804